MAARAAVFVSKRLQPPVAALLCLMAVQLGTLSLSSCHPEALPMAASMGAAKIGAASARVPIQR